MDRQTDSLHLTEGPVSTADRFTTSMGITVRAEADGDATVEMVVREDQTNAVGRLHGGALFALADAAISRAAHRPDQVSVVTVASMSFLRAAFPGDTLVARAIEEHRGRRLGVYRAEVSCAGRLIATATGQSMPL